MVKGGASVLEFMNVHILKKCMQKESKFLQDNCISMNILFLFNITHVFYLVT